MLSRLSLRTILVAGAILAAAVPATVVGVRSAAVGRRDHARERMHDNLALARGLAAACDHVLATHLGTIRTMAAHLAAAGAPTSPVLTPMLERTVLADPTLDSILVVDAAGRAVAFYPVDRAHPRLGLGVTFAERPWFRRVATERRPFADGTALVDEITDKPSVALRVPLLDEAGGFRGAVTATLDLGAIRPLASLVTLGATGSVLVVSAGGLVLADARGETASRTSLAGHPVWSQVVAGPTGLLPPHAWSGGARLGGFATVPATGWKVLATQAVSEVEAEAGHRLGLALGWVAGAFALAVGPMIVLALVIARPITALVEATRRIGEGDLTARVPLRRGPAELAGLARAFDDMAQALERNATRLRDVEADRRTTEARLRLASIVESSDDAIMAETLDGVIVAWNAAAAAMYGYAAGEVIGQPVSLLTPAAHRAEMRHVLEKIRAGEPIRALRTVHQRKDGTEIEVALTVSPIRGHGGAITGLSTIARDVTAAERAGARRDG